jgi:hypothetical protein
MDNMEPCGYPASDCHFASQMDKHRDAIHELTQKLDKALAENKTLALALKEEMAVSEARKTMADNHAAQRFNAESVQELTSEKLRVALLQVRALVDALMVAQGGIIDAIVLEDGLDGKAATVILGEIHEAFEKANRKDAIMRVGQGTETRKDTSPTERPCCVEAYARGYAVGEHHASLHQPKGKDILGALPDLPDPFAENRLSAPSCSAGGDCYAPDGCGTRKLKRDHEYGVCDSMTCEFCKEYLKGSALIEKRDDDCCICGKSSKGGAWCVGCQVNTCHPCWSTHVARSH